MAWASPSESKGGECPVAFGSSSCPSCDSADEHTGQERRHRLQDPDGKHACEEPRRKRSSVRFHGAETEGGSRKATAERWHPILRLTRE